MSNENKNSENTYVAPAANDFTTTLCSSEHEGKLKSYTLIIIGWLNHLVFYSTDSMLGKTTQEKQTRNGSTFIRKDYLKEPTSNLLYY